MVERVTVDGPRLRSGGTPRSAVREPVPHAGRGGGLQQRSHHGTAKPARQLARIAEGSAPAAKLQEDVCPVLKGFQAQLDLAHLLAVPVNGMPPEAKQLVWLPEGNTPHLLLVRLALRSLDHAPIGTELRAHPALL